MSGPNRSRRPSPWEWAQTVLLSANLAWTTLCLGGYLARTMVVTSSLTAALLLAYAGAVLAEGKRRSDYDMEGGAGDVQGTPPLSHRAGWMFVPFLGYAAANVLWVTPVRWLGWFDWFGWAQAIAVFWIALNGIRSRVTEAVVWGTLFAAGVVSVVFECYQYFVAPEWLMLHRLQATQYAGRASGAFGIPNSAAAFLMLLLPVSGALALRRGAGATARIFFGWLTLVFLLGFGLTISRGAWIGFAMAMIVWPLLRGGGTWRRRIGLALVIAAAVVAVGCVAYVVSPRVRERFDLLVREWGERSRPVLWRAGLHLVRDHPVWGTGGGSFDVAFEPYRPEGFVRAPQWAHNDYLNTLSDYGVVGFGLFFGAALLVLVKRPRTPALVTAHPPGTRRNGGAFGDPLVRQAQAIGLLAFALQLFVDFHFKIPALALAFATSAGFAVRRTAFDRPAEAAIHPALRSACRLAVGTLFCAAGIGTLALFLPRYRAESLRQEARDRIDLLVDEPTTSPRFRARVADARLALDRAVGLAPDNAQAWADRAYAGAQWARVETGRTAELGRQAEADATRAIALTPRIAEFWIRRGVARDMQGRWLDAGTDFTRAIQLSPAMPLPWYYYAYHLSLDPTGRDLADAMVATCLRLDPNNRDGIRLRQQLAVGRTGP